MRILSNDYRSNLPNESAIAHGGPANFAQNFSNYVVSHKHEWIGIIQREHEINSTLIEKVFSNKNKTYFNCTLSQQKYREFLKSENKENPKKWFAEEISVIRKLIREINPNILFLNGFSVYAWLLLEAASQEKLPIVIQHAGIARLEFEQYSHLYSTNGIKTMIEMEKDIVAKATKQIFLNNYSRATFSKIVKKVPTKQSMVIPLPYAKELLDIKPSKKSTKKKSDTLTIGCVARWDRIKNHKAFLEVAKEAAAQHLPWKFRSVTKIPESQIEIELKNAYKKHIEVIEPVERQKLLKVYETFDILILPSHFDVSPTVVMEAAMLNKPTLISKGVGWNSEYKEYGMQNWITDFSDSKKVINKIKNLDKNKSVSVFKKMIKKTHAPKTVFKKYLEVFNDTQRICE